MAGEASQDDVLETLLGVNGMENMGNTCYLSSIFQVMSHLPEVVDYFKGDKYLSHLKGSIKRTLAYRLHILVKNQYENSDSTITPENIIKWLDDNTEIPVYEQQDCHEAIIVILDKLHEELKYDMLFKTDITNNGLKEGLSFWDNKFSYIYHLFQGMYIQPSGKYEPNNNLMLDIPATDTGSVTLEECIAKSDIKVVIYPKILILMLRRYTDQKSKITTQVEYPRVLTFFDKQYDLSSFIVHKGRRVTSGHYIAVCKAHGIADMFIEFDDESCSKSTSSFKKDVYMLFYRLQ
jgi:ubiquitin C-terminal hydrolase